mgnify:CR=1 FL=1
MYTCPDGRKYEGNFLNDQYHGEFIFTKPSGHVYRQVRENGTEISSALIKEEDKAEAISEFRQKYKAYDVKILSDYIKEDEQTPEE